MAGPERVDRRHSHPAAGQGQSRRQADHALTDHHHVERFRPGGHAPGRSRWWICAGIAHKYATPQAAVDAPVYAARASGCRLVRATTTRVDDARVELRAGVAVELGERVVDDIAWR